MFVDNSVDMERFLSDRERGGDETLGVWRRNGLQSAWGTGSFLREDMDKNGSFADGKTWEFSANKSYKEI